MAIQCTTMHVPLPHTNAELTSSNRQPNEVPPQPGPTPDPTQARCQREYRWNWPGDVRVAQCLLDVGVPVTWVHSFHAENPHVIIHKAKPPPGSVPVGLHLPPLSFHHVDLDTLHQLERMQVASPAATQAPAQQLFTPLHNFYPNPNSVPNFAHL